MSSGGTGSGGGVRLRRIKADYERIVASLAGSKRIRVLRTLGNPPEKYLLEYLVKSLVQNEQGEIRERRTHQVEITLTRAYPRQAPQCRTVTPVFHPNIAPHAICVGDHWAAGEVLGSLIVRIAEMLAFQSYNLKSPLNGEAARWVAQNEGSLPLDDFDFSVLLGGGEAASLAVSGGAPAGPCSNCGKPPAGGEPFICAARHVICQDCAVGCASCERVVCLRCRTAPCDTCKSLACIDCQAVCPICQRTTCGNHHARCVVCEHAHCDDCTVTCARCQKPACVTHIVAIKGRDAHLCHRCVRELKAARTVRSDA